METEIHTVAHKVNIFTAELVERSAHLFDGLDAHSVDEIDGRAIDDEELDGNFGKSHSAQRLLVFRGIVSGRAAQVRRNLVVVVFERDVVHGHVVAELGLGSQFRVRGLHLLLLFLVLVHVDAADAETVLDFRASSDVWVQSLVSGEQSQL